MLAFGSVSCGVALAALARRRRYAPIVPLRLVGSVFVLGFVLLGIAIGRWHFDQSEFDTKAQGELMPADALVEAR